MAIDIKVLDVVLPDDDAGKSDILRDSVWPVIKQDWSGQEIIEKPLTTGYVNHMAVFHTADDVKKERAMVVRVYRGKESLDERMERDFLKMQIAAHQGCFPNIRAVFQNGVIYEYAPGRNLRADDLSNPTIIRKVAAALAQFHWFDPTSVHLIDRMGNKADFRVENDYLRRTKENFRNRFTGAADDTAEERRKRQVLYEGIRMELEFVDSFLSDLDLPVANSHDDFSNNNILYDDLSGRVTILDFEFSRSGNFALYDISFMFSRYLFREHMEKMNLGTKPECEYTKKLWITAYLQRKYELEGRDPTALTPMEVDLWMTHLLIVDQLMFFYCAVRRLPFLGKDLGRPTKRFFEMNLMFYHEQKDTLIPLKQRCLHLQSQLKQQRPTTITEAMNQLSLCG